MILSFDFSAAFIVAFDCFVFEVNRTLYFVMTLRAARIKEADARVRPAVEGQWMNRLVGGTCR